MVKNSLQDFKVPEIKREKTLFPKREEKKIIIKDSKENKSHSLWFLALVAIVFLTFALSLFFSSAKVVIYPKEKELVLDTSFTAVKDGTNDSDLDFDTVSLVGEDSKNVATTTLEDSNISARGKAIIYNSFSTTAQKLAINTRLEGSNGKMYKTTVATVIPGMSKDKVPGLVEVDIYGAEAGVEYNSTPLDFKLFGFKGGPKYEKIYGRGKGDIAGGFKGKVPVLTEEEKTKLRNELTTSLKSKLLKKVSDQLPAGFLLFKDGAFFDIDPNPSFVMGENNTVSMTMKGTINCVLFNEKYLTKFIAQKTLHDYQNEDVYIPNIQNIVFELTNKDAINVVNSKNIDFSLKGNIKIVWKVDVDSMKSKFLGLDKKSFNNVLSKYPNIGSADLIVRPLWISSLPEKEKKITISVQYPK